MFNLLLLTNEECYKEQDIVLKCYDKLYANENTPFEHIENILDGN